jgi:phosphatidate cytidylyltransferase
MGLVFLISLFMLPSEGFMAFMGLVLLAGAWEWSNLSGFDKPHQRISFCLLVVLMLFAVAFYIGVFEPIIKLEQVRSVLLVACTWWALALLWIQGYPASAVLWGSRWVRVVVGCFVLVPAWVSFSYLHQLTYGPWLILLAMLTIFVADTGAYFFGKAFGKRKLAQHVSPGKSWEGFWGGLFCCMLLAVIVGTVSHIGNWLSLLLVLSATGFASVIGDLLESMVKRHRGIKDSGHLLPGHGGMMDRLDSITAAAPVFVLGAILSGWAV